LQARAGALWVLETSVDLSNNKSHTQLFRVDLSTGARVQWTQGEQSVRGFDVHPSGAVAFCRSPGADAPPQLWVLDPGGGEARKLTDLPLGAQDPKWLPHGGAIIVRSDVYADALTVDAARERRKSLEGGNDPHITENRLFRYWDQWICSGEVPHLFRVDRDTGETNDLTPAWSGWLDLMDASASVAPSPDGARLAVAWCEEGPKSEAPRQGIWLLDIASLEARCLTLEPQWDHERPVWHPSGAALLYGQRLDPDSHGSALRLVAHDVGTGERRVLLAGGEWSPRQWAFDPSGEAIWLLAERRASVGLWRMPFSGGAPEAVHTDGTVAVFDISDTGALFGVWSSLTDLPQVVQLSAASREVVIDGNAALRAQVALGAAESVETVGANGDTVQSWLVFPPDFRPGTPRPLLHLLHGGPHGMWSNEQHLRWNAQVFANAGYVVVLTNFHGSSSFGDVYTKSIEGSWGDAPLQDVEAVTDALIARGVARPDALYVAGASYGGYLTAWLTTQTTRYRAAVVHAGVFDLRLLFASDYNIGITRFVMGAEPWADRAVALRQDPASYIGGAQTPTLVTHGVRDYRCTLDQGLALYSVLKSRGVPTRLVAYPEENHWILKPKNSVHWYGEVLRWFERHAPVSST
jgi:dipeptidyl aminopeptidase/acylaminoacyl peptidase